MTIAFYVEHFFWLLPANFANTFALRLGLLEHGTRGGNQKLFICNIVYLFLPKRCCTKNPARISPSPANDEAYSPSPRTVPQISTDRAGVA